MSPPPPSPAAPPAATLRPTRPAPAPPASGAREPVDIGQLRALVTALIRVRTRTRTRFGRTGRSRGLVFQIVLYAISGVLVGMLATLGTDLFSFELILFGITLFFAGF
jgi:hypothetical protein